MRKSGGDVQKKFVYGIGILFAFIALGIFAAETQLNALTLESEFAKVLNVKRDHAAKEVALYCLGERISLGEWETPTVEISSEAVIVHLGEDKKAILSMSWLGKLTEQNREDVVRDLYGYYQKAGESAQTMRKTLERSYGAILEDLSYYLR